MKPGERVRLKANPSRVGIITDEYDGPPRRRRVLVIFSDGDEDFILLKSLEKVEGDTLRPYALIQQGRYGKANDLRGAITYYRLSGKLANLIYSLNTTNTQFFAYQFKPVLQLLDSPCRGLLIADEVGLGKTIEAGLIWTELRARVDARRLLVICPAMLREKWQDELKIRFGMTADICDSRELLRRLKKSEDNRHDEFALIASLQGLRPSKGWDKEIKEERHTAKLARYLESKQYEDPLFDMVVVDEAHYLRNPHTQTHKLGRLLRPVCENLLLLSATPIQLRSDDLFHLLNLLDEDAFPFPNSFERTLALNAPIVQLRDRLLRENLKQSEFIEILKKVSSKIVEKNSHAELMRDIYSSSREESLKKTLELSNKLLAMQEENIDKNQESPENNDISHQIKEQLKKIVLLSDLEFYKQNAKTSLLNQGEYEEQITKGNSQLNHLIANPPTDEELQSSQGRSLFADRLDRLNPLAKVISRTRKRDVQEMRVIRVPNAVMAKMTPVESAFYDAVTDGVREFCAGMDISTGFLLTIPQRQMASCMAAACRSWLERIGSFNDSDEINQTVYEAFGDSENENWHTNQEKLGTLLTLLASLTEEVGDYQQLKANDTKYAQLKRSLLGYWRENPGKKVVLFSFYRETLRYLHERLQEDGVSSLVVKGGMDKHAAIKEFATPEGANIMLSTEVAAEGVDLQFSSLLINYDLPWNPMRIEQRIGRIDRIGQEAERILIWNFLYSDSIDERIYNRLLDRLNIFENALGGMEAILGEQIREMGYDLLVHKLTPEEEEIRIEQTAIAMETISRRNEMLEEDATQLIAHGDYIQNQVKAAREIGRYVTGGDLYIYVHDFFMQEYEGTRLLRVDDKDLLFEMEFSVDAKIAFQEFLESQHLSGKTRVCTAKSPRIFFENNVGTNKYKAEVISQHHPLILFVNRRLKDKGKAGGYFPVAAAEISKCNLNNIPSGIYVYAVARWSVIGARVIERLSYVVKKSESGEWLDQNDAESLVNAAASEGRNWHGAATTLNHNFIAATYDECLEQLELGFSLFEGDIKRENNDRIDLMIGTLERHRDTQKASLDKRINDFKASGEKKKLSMIPATEGLIKKLERNIEEKIVMLKKKQVVESSEGVVSGGVIRVY
jgi:SNF2 family DNA or RNA helicase